MKRNAGREDTVWIFEDQKFRISDWPKVGSFTLNENTTPRQLDLHLPGSSDSLGIYAIEGNTLKWLSVNNARAAPVGRPKSMDDPGHLIILEREKE